MATLSRTRFLGLIDRFFHGPHVAAQAPHRSSDVAIRAMASAHAFSGDEIDKIWLRRVELRSVRQVGDALNAMGFRSRWGCLTTMFVDEGCGMICAENLESADIDDGEIAVHRVLKLASGYQADGMILATNALGGAIAGREALRDFTMRLHRKGHAIGVPVLDHLVLTRNGWGSLFIDRTQHARRES